MKICLAVRALPVHRLGGLEFHTHDLANALAAADHDVTIITSAYPVVEPRERETLESGVNVEYLRTGKPGDYSLSFFREIETRIAALDSRIHFDVIHAQEFAGIFVRARPRRFVTTVHGTLFTEVPLDRRYLNRLCAKERLAAIWRYKSRLALHAFFIRSLRRADRLIVDSEFTFRELMLIDGTLRSKAEVVPLGVDLSRYQPAYVQHHSDSPALRVALLGRVQRQKGILVAAEAMRILSSRNVSVEMTIGGTGEDAANLSKFITSHNLTDQIKLVGRIPDDQLSVFFREADVFLFPDLTQPAFGLVAVEAMLHGLLVIGARSGAIPEVVTNETGWIYNAWSAHELAELIQRLASTSRSEILKKSEAARTHALKFTSDRMAEQVLDVYSRL